MPDIGQAPGEPPEWSAMARTAVSQMSLQEVLGRGLLEIATVWSVTWVVRAVVKKFGDAAHKARAPRRPPAAPRAPSLEPGNGSRLVARQRAVLRTALPAPPSVQRRCRPPWRPCQSECARLPAPQRTGG